MEWHDSAIVVGEITKRFILNRRSLANFDVEIIPTLREK